MLEIVVNLVTVNKLICKPQNTFIHHKIHLYFMLNIYFSHKQLWCQLIKLSSTTVSEILAIFDAKM